ncbi:hypothetical protein B0G69_3140 [Paraburkholderia sp. RAU2J]|uniref:hypothetical protein n=1 Tax=Paraburkholderia sp. RAU2J TaxID=1938810 RepID=UPI000EB23E7B|nr:hypothetical protein [Paraburkholderia sp. RAU2J]RKT27326.1 hypothetical protein B0G69_3140 [Paraburkholderia sp. RAU2J]
MNLFFWMLLNLGVPIVGPIFTLALVAPAHGWHVAKALIGASVKDGQLFWCAIGLCASAVYEAVTALERGNGELSLLAFSIVGFCVVAFSCSIVVLLCSLSVCDEHWDATAGDRTAWGARRILSRSAIGLTGLLTFIVATMFAILHIHLNSNF